MNTKISTILPNRLKVKNNKTGNNYCIYTDNTFDKNQKLRLYVAAYNPNLDKPFLGEPKTKEEWFEITKVIDSIIPST